MKIRVLLVGDHSLLRETLRTFPDRELDIEIVGEAGDGRDAFRRARGAICCTSFARD